MFEDTKGQRFYQKLQFKQTLKGRRYNGQMTKNRKTMVDKILHRKLNIEPHELHYKMWDELRCSKMAGSSYLWYTK